MPDATPVGDAGVEGTGSDCFWRFFDQDSAHRLFAWSCKLSVFFRCEYTCRFFALKCTCPYISRSGMSCTWPHYDVMMSQTLAWSCHSVRPGASLAHSAISVYSYSWMVRLKYASVHCAGCSAYIGLHRSVYQATSSIPILLYVVICCACG